MKTHLFLFVVILIVLLSSCTANKRARSYGGTETINLDRNTKVVNCTWKEADLWILTEPMNPQDQPRKLEFRESSAWGVFNGKVVIIENK